MLYLEDESSWWQTSSIYQHLYWESWHIYENSFCGRVLLSRILYYKYKKAFLRGFSLLNPYGRVITNAEHDGESCSRIERDGLQLFFYAKWLQQERLPYKMPCKTELWSFPEQSSTLHCTETEAGDVSKYEFPLATREKPKCLFQLGLSIRLDFHWPINCLKYWSWF